MGFKGRDVEVVGINETQYLVTACDSSGAIGEKELDVVKVPSYITGRFATRVALLEVMAAGAAPRVLTAAISNEPSPTGEGILKGVYDELKSIGLESLPIAISTEKNMRTSQTAVGITVVGVCEKDSLRIGMSKPGDLVYCIGLPKVGNEISSAEDTELVQGKRVMELLNIKGVHDIVPIGSSGIAGEIEKLCNSLRCTFILEKDGEIDIVKSGGPSTCAIFTCGKDAKLPEMGQTPIIKIGSLEEW